MCSSGLARRGVEAFGRATLKCALLLQPSVAGLDCPSITCALVVGIEICLFAADSKIPSLGKQLN